MRGLDIFKEHFMGYEDSYVLIGGTACTLLLEEAGANFRATKDLDIVLIMENVDKDFADKFWSFIKAGQYKNIFAGQEIGKFYRFEKPENNNYPIMIELFSKLPEKYEIIPESHLLPLHIAEDVSSLSAILLNSDYYNFLLQGRKYINGVCVLDELHLIPFKAKAWCELTDRQNSGMEGLTKHIKKHKKDSAILLLLIAEGQHVKLSGDVLEDMQRFVKAMEKEQLDEHTTGIKNMTTEKYCGLLKKIFSL